VGLTLIEALVGALLESLDRDGDSPLRNRLDCFMDRFDWLNELFVRADGNERRSICCRDRSGERTLGAG
jgi:hypothetical protein